jgi:hypothetical protein
MDEEQHQTRQERRAARLDAARGRIKKSGKSLGALYAAAVLKRAGRIGTKRRSKKAP